jgi:hypothetical protein
VKFGVVRWRPQSLTGKQIAQVHSILGVAMQRLADALLQPIALLAAVVWLLDGSFGDVALITVVASASLALGSVAMPYVLSLVEDVRLVILGASTVRAAAAALISILGWRVTSLEQSDFVALLIVSVIFYQIGSAVNVVTNPRSTIVSVEQPTMARSRQVAGAVAGIIGGLVAWRTLGNAALTFPRSAGWLLALAGIASISAIWFQITAPVRRGAFGHKPSLVSREEVQVLLQAGTMRRFLGFRLLFGFADLADPFLVIYGIVQMGLGLRYVGAIILVLTLAQVAGGIIWTVFRRAEGTRRSLQIAAMLRLAGIAIAAGVPLIANSEAYDQRFGSPNFGSWAFVTAFILLGLGQSTYLRNEQAYARRIADDESLYPAAIMLTNFSLILTSTAAFVGVWIIDISSLESAIVVAAMISFLALLSSGLLVGRRTPRRRALSPSLRGARKPIRVRKRRRFRRRKPQWQGERS